MYKKIIEVKHQKTGVPLLDKIQAKLELVKYPTSALCSYAEVLRGDFEDHFPLYVIKKTNSI